MQKRLCLPAFVMIAFDTETASAFLPVQTPNAGALVYHGISLCLALASPYTCTLDTYPKNIALLLVGCPPSLATCVHTCIDPGGGVHVSSYRLCTGANVFSIPAKRQ